MVPMKANMEMPAVRNFGFSVSTHCPALRPRGEIRTIRATICSQKNGTGPKKRDVSGLKMKAKSKNIFNTITGTHFRFMRKPIETQFTNAVRKSRPKKTGALTVIPKKVPIIMLRPPIYGPKIIPYNGGRKSEIENVWDRPIIGPRGIGRKAAYNAEKTIKNETILVLLLMLLNATKP